MSESILKGITHTPLIIQGNKNLSGADIFEFNKSKEYIWKDATDCRADLHLIDCDSDNLLNFCHDTLFERGKYKMIYAEGTDGTSVYHPHVVNLSISSVKAELVRLGPASQLWASGVDEEGKYNEFDRLVCEGDVKLMSHTKVNQLVIHPGATVYAYMHTTIKEVTVNGILRIEDPSVELKGTIDLRPGGVIWFKEEEESPHLDVLTHRSSVTRRETFAFDHYTVIFG